ncbi:MAG: hypothetical protein HRT40_09370, partial [Campylobacteraceae bacterium]|nr:hypothetical protein [Campylobacteraceae bacterium]
MIEFEEKYKEYLEIKSSKVSDLLWSIRVSSCRCCMFIYYDIFDKRIH